MNTQLGTKMNNDYSISTIESNFYTHKIGNIAIVTFWVDGNGNGCEVRVRVPPNSKKLQVFVAGGTGNIRQGMIVYPTGQN